MKILATIAHYFDPAGGGYYGSTGPNAEARRLGLINAIASLHQLFGKAQAKLLNRKQKIMVPANAPESYDIDVVVCTTQGKHLVNSLDLPSHFFEHRETEAEPLMLGFECRRVLAERPGTYEFYCYLEDDLVVLDPWFFAKLRWFSSRAGDEALLQPNRFEVSTTEPIPKIYIDGHLSAEFAGTWQNIKDRPTLKGSVLGATVLFERPTNPHSGCFFLNKTQMAEWAAKPYFLDRDISFAGPLESAATLGIMKTFRIYKPANDNAGFFEILHANNRYLGNWLKL